MFKRRCDLTGVELNVNLPTENHPFVSTVSKELLDVFQRYFNFTIRWKPWPGPYGNFINNSWTGLMKEIIENEVDLSIILDFTHSPERIEYVSPGFTLSLKGIVVYFWKSSYLSSDIFSLLSVFSTEFWMILTGTIILFFLVLHITKLLERYPNFKFTDSLYFLVAIMQALLSQTFDESTFLSIKKSSLKKSFKMIFFVLSMMGSVIFATYSGCLISILASNKLHVPFSTTEELAKLSNFQLKSFGGGSTYSWLKSITKRVKGFDRVLAQNIDPYSFDIDSDSFISNTKKWLIDNRGPNVGLITEEGWLEHNSDSNDVNGGYNSDYSFDYCDIITVPMKEYQPVRRGWVYPKNSLLQPLFDKYMLKLYQNGIINRIEDFHTTRKYCTENNGYLIIQFGFVKILFILLLIGISTSLIIGLYEKFV